MLDKQAAVIYRRVTRWANGFAMMKKQHLSSFVAVQGTLVPCVFFFRQTFKQALVAFLFVFVFFELKRFASGAVLSFAKKMSASFQF